MNNGKPFVLVIMDGWGIATPWGGNAITLAKTPTTSYFWKNIPRAILGAAGESVGLPKGERGNSEVGHINIGSGRIVHQDLPSISNSIEDGTFFDNKVLKTAMNTAKERKVQLHIIGLMSNGGIHSHISHTLALLDMAKKENVDNICVHAFTDGRDSSPMDSLKFIEALEMKLAEINNGAIASVVGRYYAMDRDNRWDRVERVYKLLTEGMGKDAISARDAVASAYRDGKTDEFIEPTIIRQKDHTVRTIKDNDVIIMTNFRADRSRELTKALVQEDFKNFKRSVVRKNLKFISFNSYHGNLPIELAFEQKEVEKPLAEVLSDAGLKQLHIAETEKYPHVTYFFNGGREEPFPNEDRVMIPSPKVATYDLKPEMSAYEVKSEFLKKFNKYNFTIVNFANPDMVGHTGNIRAAKRAVEVVDECVGDIWRAVAKAQGSLIVTADHGNVEQMINPETSAPDTEHTTNPVPFFFISSDNMPIKTSGILSDISPTILEYLNLEKPSGMTGTSLINNATQKVEAAAGT